MVEMKVEIVLRSQTIPWIELAQRKLRIRSMESGRGYEDLQQKKMLGRSMGENHSAIRSFSLIHMKNG